MFEALSDLLLTTSSSLIIEQNFSWNSKAFSNFLERKKAGLRVILPGFQENDLYNSKFLFIDLSEDFTKYENLNLEKFLFDSHQVCIIKSPLHNSNRFEEVLLNSKKEIFLLKLKELVPLNHFRFISLSCFSPQFKKVIVKIVGRLLRTDYIILDKRQGGRKEGNCNSFRVIGILQPSCDASKIYPLLLKGAKSQKRCYILGIPRPREFKCRDQKVLL